MRLNRWMSPIPTARATSISSLVSIMKVVRPSMSEGLSPASRMALRTASHASESSETPEFLEYFVWPMPTMAASSLRVVGNSSPSLGFASLRGTCLSWLARSARAVACPSSWKLDPHRRGHVIAPTVGARDLDRDPPLRRREHLAAELQRVAGHVGTAELGSKALHDRFGSRPVADVAPDQAIRGQDVHEDVGKALRLRGRLVVMDRCEVSRRERPAHHERRGGRHVQGRKLLAHLHLFETSGRLHRTSPGPLRASSCPRLASVALAPPSRSSSALDHRK